MAQGGGVHTTMKVAVGVGVEVSVGVKVGVNEGVLVGVAGLVGLAVGVLKPPPFLLLKERMITPRTIARMAMNPIMVLDFIRFSQDPGQVDF